MQWRGLSPPPTVPSSQDERGLGGITNAFAVSVAERLPRADRLELTVTDGTPGHVSHATPLFIAARVAVYFRERFHL